MRHILLRDRILNHCETSRFVSHIFDTFVILALTLITWDYVCIIGRFFVPSADNITTKEAAHEAKGNQ